MCDTPEHNHESTSSTVIEEPLLGSQQVDIDLLAAEIAEAATEEERRSRTPSPELECSSQAQHSRLKAQDNVEDVDKGIRDKNEEDELGSNSDVPMDMSVIQESPSSCNIDDSVLELSVIEEPSSGCAVDDSVLELSVIEEPSSGCAVDDSVLDLNAILQQEDMDEASWVLVEADIDDPSLHSANDTSTESENKPKLKCVFRKFLAGHEMGDKLLELGLTCESVQDSGFQEIEMNDSGIDHPSENFLKSIEETPKIAIWRGEVSGAKVCVEGESKGGLLVADVRLWHTDLLQALATLKNLANNAGLISYADVDIPSILARAA